MKNTLLFCLMLFSLNTLVLGQTKPLYAFVAYHKLHPGKTMDDALKMEQAWKLFHQQKKEAGLITDWSIYSVWPYLQSPEINFDYVSIDYGYNMDSILQFPAHMLVKLDSALKTVDANAAYITRSEMLVMDAQVGTYQTHDWLWMEEMQVRPENYQEYRSFEQKMTAVHQKRVKVGNISHWSLWRRVLPGFHNGAFTFFTLNEHPSMSAMENGAYTDDMLKSTLNMTLDETFMKASALRTISSSWILTRIEKL